MQYEGSCHCGRIAFTVEGSIDKAMACNCSMCQRKGSLLWFGPRTALTLKTPESDLGTYQFNKHVIDHRFCAVCGIHPFAEGKDKQGNGTVAVNVRCLENFDLDSVQVTHYDGRSK